MGTRKVKKIIEDDVYYFPCIECGCDDIEFYNCGYSTFNVCTVTCKECGNTVNIKSLMWDAKDVDMIPFWNKENDPNILIPVLEAKIKELTDRLNLFKSRLPND